MLVVGLLTPLACAGVIGVMLVALITNHLKNGFFIFRPGEGYEYVLTLTVVAFCLAMLGAGEWSLDDALEHRRHRRLERPAHRRRRRRGRHGRSCSPSSGARRSRPPTSPVPSGR